MLLDNQTEFGMSRRWYDDAPELGKALKQLESLPPDIRNIVVEGVITITEREFQISKLMNSHSSLGIEKLQHLYKSMSKRRSYDAVEPLHRTMNHMTVLSEENRQFVCQQVQQLSEYIYTYLRQCAVVDSSHSSDDVNNLTNAFVSHGASEQVDMLLRQLEQRLTKNVGQHLYNLELKRTQRGKAKRPFIVSDGDMKLN